MVKRKKKIFVWHLLSVYNLLEMSLAHQRNHETNGVTVSCSLQATDTISADRIRTMLHSGVVYSCSMWGLQRGTPLCLLSQGAQQHVSQCAAVVTLVVRNRWWCTGMGPRPRSHFHPNPLGTGPSVNLTPWRTETAVTELHFLQSISFNIPTLIALAYIFLLH